MPLGPRTPIKYVNPYWVGDTMRRQLWIALLLAAAAGLAAGCIGDTDETMETMPGDTADAPWHEAALPHGDDHDHTDRSQHAGLTTPNFEVVGFDPLFSPYYDQPAGSYFCGDASPTRDERTLAVVESRSDVGFAIADVTNPEDPRWIGEFVMETTHIYDLAVAPDGEHVLLVTSDIRDEAQPDTPVPANPLPRSQATAGDTPSLTWHSACSSEPVTVTSAEEDPVPRPMSLLLVSIEDPEEPEIIEQRPITGNGHSVFTETIDGDDWVLVTTSRTPSPTNPPLVSHNTVSAYEFYHLQEAPHGATLEHLSTYKPPPGAGDDLSLGPRGHDGWMNKHPGTGEVYAYLSGGERFTILDMTQPRAPEELSRWHPTGEGTAAETGLLHSAYPLDELRDGRHFTLIGPEHHERPDPYPSGIIWALDTTDPAQPEAVAAWTLPADVEWDGTYMFSNHYFSVYEDTLFASQYHGGMWAIDLSPLAQAPDGPGELTHLDSVGVFIPDRDPPQEPAVQQRWAPTLEEALAMPDGTIVTFDGNAGLYTLAFDAETPMPAPTPWPIHHPGAG